MVPKRITIIAFNIGTAGSVVNGPGICLYNFIKFMNSCFPEINIVVYSYLNSKEFIGGIDVRSIKDVDDLHKSIKLSDVVHHWSGISGFHKKAILYANSVGVKVVIGPNVLDTVMYDEESKYLSDIKFDKILTVNNFLKIRIAKKHNIFIDKINIFMVGPDLKLWEPSGSKGSTILWKGNSRHFVKDVEFGLEIAKKLTKYKFNFIGYPKPYDYFEHIDEAKRSRLYFCTSLSETMGMALMEQWSCGVPSITHPRVYLHGINYKTGIITDRTVDSYCDAIVEIMEDEYLYQILSNGCYNFMKNNFSKETICNKYLSMLENH